MFWQVQANTSQAMIEHMGMYYVQPLQPQQQLHVHACTYSYDMSSKEMGLYVQYQTDQNRLNRLRSVLVGAHTNSAGFNIKLLKLEAIQRLLRVTCTYLGSAHTSTMFHYPMKNFEENSQEKTPKIRKLKKLARKFEKNRLRFFLQRGIKFLLRHPMTMQKQSLCVGT